MCSRSPPNRRSTAPTAEGPWKYGGVVIPTQGKSFTDHPGIVDYKGKTYLFYHNGALPAYLDKGLSSLDNGPSTPPPLDDLFL